MLRKKIYVYFYSLKSSVKKKPMAFALLILAVAIIIITGGWASRISVGELESALYGSLEIKELSQELSTRQIGDAMRKLREDRLFDYNSTGKIRQTALNIEVYCPNKQLVKDLEMQYIVFGNDYIGEQYIAENKNVVAIDDKFAQFANIGYGDTIAINGIELEIVSVRKSTDSFPDEYEFMLPYAVDLNLSAMLPVDDAGEETPKFRLLDKYAYFYDLARTVTNQEIKYLKDLGIVCKKSGAFSSPVIMGIVITSLFVGVSLINLLVVMRYWLKVNDKKYALYKILGAKPKLIAGGMFLEGVVIVAIGIGLGVLLEYFLSQMFMAVAVIKKLLWVHYLMLVSIATLAIMIPLAIRVIRRSKANAIDKKYFN